MSRRASVADFEGPHGHEPVPGPENGRKNKPPQQFAEVVACGGEQGVAIVRGLPAANFPGLAEVLPRFEELVAGYGGNIPDEVAGRRLDALALWQYPKLPSLLRNVKDLRAVVVVNGLFRAM